MQVTRIEDGLGVRLPASMITELKLQEGDEVDVSVIPRRSGESGKAELAMELVAGLRRYRGTLPRGFQFDREEANERR